jgi:hypothetical protein
MSHGEGAVEHLTLISDVADRELDAIRRTVRAYDRVGGHESVVVILQDHALRGTRADALDLVGHSRDHGFLVLGSWLLDDSPQTAGTFSQDIAPALDTIGVRAVRLLGCSTATSLRGISALAQISRATRREVYGTRRYVSKHDYRSTGFISDDALLGPQGTFSAKPDSVGFLAGAATNVMLASLDLNAGPRLTSDHPIAPVNAGLATRLLELVDGSRSWVIAGLLAEPSPIVLWSHDNAIHRLDVLCDCQVVRGYGAYPDDEHGRLFRVRDPEGLSRYLAAWLRPRSAPRARTT